MIYYSFVTESLSTQADIIETVAIVRRFAG